jgi:hypothetical protein
MHVETPRDVGYWRDVVAAEYEDLPVLSLTFPQAMRLWGLDEVTCRYVLDSFIESGYLRRTEAGQYRRTDMGKTSRTNGEYLSVHVTPRKPM